MKILILLALCFLRLTTAYASQTNYGLYTGLNYGTAADDGSGSEKLTGPVYGVGLGYRWIHYALEIGYTKFDVKSEGGVTDYATIDKATMDATSIDFIFRGFFWRYFTAGVGFSSINAKQDFRFSNIMGNPSNTYTFNEDSDYTGSIFQLGIVLPLLRSLDLQLLYERRSWMNNDPMVSNDPTHIEPLGGDFQKFSGQLVYYFR